ncbi:MAG: hypothetical protein QM504_05825 [Pseudomonadota bacterium]
MNKKLTHQDLLKLNSLLNDTLQHADKDQLINCVRILGTAVASLKIKYKADEEKIPQDVKKLVSDMEQDSLSDELSEVLSKSIIECATAIAVVKQAKDQI